MSVPRPDLQELAARVANEWPEVGQLMRAFEERAREAEAECVGLREERDEARAANPMWEKVQAQQTQLRKLQRKYNTVKGDLRATNDALSLESAEHTECEVLLVALREYVEKLRRGLVAAVDDITNAGYGLPDEAEAALALPVPGSGSEEA